MKTCTTENSFGRVANSVLSMLVAVALILTFAGCGSNNTSGTASGGSTPEVEKSESEIQQMIVNEICKKESVDSIYGLVMSSKEHISFNCWDISGQYFIKDKYGNTKANHTYDATIRGSYVSVSINYNI